MRKNRTRRTFGRRARQCAAIFVATAALWLIWLTADPMSLLAQLREAAGNTDLALTLLSAELGSLEGGGLSTLERMVLAQSPLLSASAPAETLSPPPSITTEEPLDQDEQEDDPLPLTTTAPEGIIGKTMVAGNTAKYVNSSGVSIYNHTDYALNIDTLLDAAPDITDQNDGPQVLIFHSHATEAYTMDGTDIYEESDSYRTLDTDQNVVRVGREMAAILEAAGIEVIHDTTLYDYPATTRPTSAPAKGWRSGWSSTPPSGWSSTSTGTPWPPATAPSTRPWQAPWTTAPR